MQISFTKHKLPKTGSVVVACFEDGKFSDSAKALDKELKGALKKAMTASAGFKGKRGQRVVIPAPMGMDYAFVVLLGFGKPGELTHKEATDLGGKIYDCVNGAALKEVTVMVDAAKGSSISEADLAAYLGHGAALKSYRFDIYKTKQKEDAKAHLAKLSFATASDDKAKKTYKVLDAVREGVFLTRDLISEPANVLHPESYAKRVSKELSAVGIKVSVLDEKQMKKLGFGALLGVAQGSEKKPRLVCMEYNGNTSAKGEAKRPLALVGKGVTFDTGGVSIKPSAGMEEMKWDMGGSGVVVGTMYALAKRKAKANVVGIIGLVENMVSERAQRPGDVVKSYSGQTVEVINTDAEGRLVLADALWYTQEKYKPRAVIDLATLTGAMIIALGSEYAGVFSNRDDLAEKLCRVSSKVGELLWHMPIGEGYDKQLESEIADMRNISRGREAGSCTAAAFLHRFIKEDVPWAHIDIAGVTWSKKAGDIAPKGGTGFGVRVLNEFILEEYEKK